MNKMEPRPLDPGNNKRESFTPEQKRNYMMAAELSIRTGELRDAAQLYREISREDLAEGLLDQQKPERRKLNPQVEQLFKRLIQKNYSVAYYSRRLEEKISSS